MIKLSVCIPTYQNPELIMDLINNELEQYYDLGIYLYIFDSSVDDRTKTIVENYQKKFDNLFYFRFPSTLHSNKKVYQIFQMAKDNIIPCEYLWIRADNLLCQQDFLRLLLNYLEYDIIVTAPNIINKQGIREVSDYQVFFEEYAWLVCLYGAVILNVERMIKTADWKALSSKYLCQQYINFSHLCFYFEQIIKLNDCKIVVLDLPNQMYYGNPKKKTGSWYKDFFDIWLKRWPDTINCLPDYYQNKEKAIRNFGINEQYFGLYSMHSLKQLVSYHILTTEILEKYHERICLYSGVDEECFRKALSSSSVQDNQEIMPDEYKALLEFISKFSNIVIYGCGKRALRYAQFLQYKNITFDKFIVTDKNKSPSFYCGHDVIGRDECDFRNKMGIILALKPEYQLEVFPFFQEKKLIGNLFAWSGESLLYNFSFSDMLKKHIITGKI